MTWVNKLYYGDCLTIMQDLPLNSVDLIYLDPPFNSDQSYNAIYRDETGRPLPVQIEAFCDTWELTEERERAIRTMPVLMRESGIEDEIVEFWRMWMNALRNTQPRLLAYLSYMVERLIVMYRIMKPNAFLYLHCDPTASHYIKALLDALFGHEYFRNEIIWKRTNAPTASAYKLGSVHDTILLYGKSRKAKLNPVYIPYSPEYVEQHFKYKDERGQYQVTPLTAQGVRYGYSGEDWREVDVTAKGLHWVCPTALPKPLELTESWESMNTLEKLDWLDSQNMIYWPKRGTMPRFKRYLSTSKGARLSDVITDVPGIQGSSKEKMGYATQKPLALLDRLIQAASSPGDVVLDPFCGCATTLEAAQRLGRKWIGIDIAIHAIKRVAQVRLIERCGLAEDRDFIVQGVPKTLEGAKDLWERDKYQFQKWAVEQVDGFVTQRRSADGGIDGRIYFELADMPDLQSMVVEVKGGKNVNVQSLRALRGILDNEDALMAGLITMEPLGKIQERNFRKFMAQAGDLVVNGFPYPRMQILSVPDILDGNRFNLPNIAGRHELRPRLIPVQPGA